MVKYNFSNRKVAILGLGEEGFFTALFLLKRGAKVTVLNEAVQDKSKELLASKLKKKGASVIIGKNTFQHLTDYDYIVRSPVIPTGRKELVKARRLGAVVLSQTQIFFSESPCLIVGITGTKGKGTVSSLIYKFLKNSSPRSIKDKKLLLKQSSKIYLTGNIGGKDAPLAILPKLKKEDIVVFELSSFQLEDLTNSPQVAVVLQIFPDHLDRHSSMKEYVNAKKKITEFQSNKDLLIINIDSPWTKNIAKQTTAQKIIVSNDPKLSKVKILDNKIIFCPDNKTQIELLDITNSTLNGSHNHLNIAIAATTAYSIGSNPKNFNRTLKSFKGLPHRLQFVGSVKGIKFYDDSIATIPEATLAAVNSFNSPIILILGGLVKNINLKNFAQSLKAKKNIKAIILFGKSQNALYEELKKTGIKSKILKSGMSMASVFDRIKMLAISGDSVLLSPGAASFDMYPNYKRRGEDFTNYVKTFNQ